MTHPSRRDPPSNTPPILSRSWRQIGCPALVVLLMALVMLACGRAGGSVPDDLERSRITELPQLLCASSTPMPTQTQPATAVQPTVYSTPGGYVTNTPVAGGQPACEWVWNPETGMYEWVCDDTLATNTPVSGGIYTTPTALAPGPTSTPRPTYTPFPTPTQFVRLTNYPIGYDVWTEGALRLRFVIHEPTYVDPDSSDDTQIVIWDVEMENLGETDYYSFVAGQTFVYEITAPSGERIQDYHFASRDALNDAGLEPDAELSDIIVLEPGMERRYTVAAYTPTGRAERLGWSLDPYSGTRGDDVVGGNVAYWLNQDSNACGEVVGPPWWNPFAERTPQPTVTPTFTPDIPVCSGCRSEEDDNT